MLCTTCQTPLLQPGNSKVVLKPTNKIPKKSLKLLTKRLSETSFLSRRESFDYRKKSSLRNLEHFKKLSKFKKYIYQRSFPKNNLIITCLSCSTKSITTLEKPLDPLERNLKLKSKSPEESGFLNKKERRKIKQAEREKNDLNAGLIIPPSLSPAPFSKSNSFSKVHTSSYLNKNEKKNRADKKKQEVERLQKALAKSNEIKDIHQDSLSSFFT